MEISENDNKKENPKYWLSLEQWKNDPEFRQLAEQEFMSSPLAEEDSKDGWARREFLKLMGASLALGAAGCVRRPAEKIIPYAKNPAEIVLGIPDWYSSSWVDSNGEAFGLLVKTREGRPIKIEGNPEHPMNRGGLSARGNAQILSLYDPERLQGPKHNLQNPKKTNRDTINITWENLDKAVVEQLKKGSVAVLSRTLASPATSAVLAEFLKAFKAQHVVWEPLCEDTVIEGQKASFGEELIPRYRFESIRHVVSIDCDFLGTYLSPTEFSKQWSKARKIGNEMARLVVFESMLSLTGMNADDRFAIRASQQVDVAMALLHHVASRAGDARVKELTAAFANAPEKLGLDDKAFAQTAEELWAHRGQSLVLAGGLTTRTTQSRQLQAAVNMLNSLLQNDGKTIDYHVPQKTLQGSYKRLAALIEDMKAGKVKTLVIHGINPAYALPKEAGFIEAARNVETVVYTGDRIDETACLAEYIATDHHNLENWGDMEAQAGVLSIQQPTIRPLYNTRAFEDSLIAWTTQGGVASAPMKAAGGWYNYLRNFWNTEIYKKHGANGWNVSNFEDFWTKLLQEGVYDLTSKVAKVAAPRRARAETLGQVKPQAPSGYELVLYPTVGLSDGTLANIAWLQEFPDPVTKICWDNYLCVSPATADKEGLREGSIVTLTVGNKKVEAPVHIQVGLHDNVLAMAVGYGREAAGKVANGIGINAFELASFNKGEPIFAGIPAQFEKTGRSYRLANPNGYNSMVGRQIVVEATLAEVIKDPNAGIHRHHVFSIWPKHKYPGHKWGMIVDLNACTGCSACITACQSENNSPVVGKRYVLEGREMNWMRVDRYHSGSPANPDSHFQPVMCQQCENAPCETVCPVLATVHSAEGLNDMVYNRCVGTRYCSNNCPYKVRRFNWFNYAKKIESPLNLALNPEVTVRTRGVMEKCTFCVHRIHEGKNKAKDRGEPLKDGEIKTACQTTCPTDAIVFGDINNPESAVSKLFKEKRGYALLEELNTQPSVRYLARIRNADRPAKPHEEEMSEENKEEGQHS